MKKICPKCQEEFNKRFKKEIKDRDGCCMICNVSIDNLRLLNRRIAIHHINYDRELTIKENCITLCNNHHSITNVNVSIGLGSFMRCSMIDMVMNM